MKTGTTMTSNRQGAHRARGAAVALLALALATPALAGGSSDRDLTASLKIEGVWGVTVTLRDCATGNPLGLPFQSLLTFEDSGTISESAGALSFAPNQRSEGHGVWKKLGPGVFSQRTIALLRFETAPNPPMPGFLAGWQVIDHVVTMQDQDNFTSGGTGDFYDTQGQLYRSGCSTAVGRRFE